MSEEESTEISEEEDAERAKAWLGGQRYSKRNFIPEAYEEHIKKQKEEEQKSEE